jgi:hypothetical protein
MAKTVWIVFYFITDYTSPREAQHSQLWSSLYIYFIMGRCNNIKALNQVNLGLFMAPSVVLLADDSLTEDAYFIRRLIDFLMMFRLLLMVG